MATYDLRFLPAARAAATAAHLEGTFDLPDPQLRAYPDACVFPSNREGGELILDSAGRAVEDANLHEGLPCAGNAPPGASVTLRDQTAIFIGTLHPVYGHAITDNLKKLWYLGTPEARQLLAQGARVVYLRHRGLSLPGYVFELMALAGLDPATFEAVETPTRFRQLLIPENAFILRGERRYFTPAFQKTIEAIRERVAGVEVPRPERIYLSRTALRSGRDYGERAVEDAFRRGGFDIVHPQELSLPHQIAILSGCRAVAATEGSIAHGAIFCRPGTTMILLKKADYTNTYQTVIEQMRDLRVTIIEAHHTLRSAQPWSGPFYLENTPHLSAFLGGGPAPRTRWLDPEWHRYLRHILRERAGTAWRPLARFARRTLRR